MVKKDYIVRYPRIQKRREDIDLKLLGQIEDFLDDKDVIVNEKEKTDLIGKIGEFKTFLQRFNKDVKVNLSPPSRKLSEEYEKRSEAYMLHIEILEKQRHAYDLLEQLFKSIDPFKLGGGYKRYFSLLLKFQEASFKYQESYRDHLIHSLRVFLLIVAIFEVLNDKWISIFKGYLHNLLKKLDIETGLLNRLSDPDLWEFSIHGASVMSLFHDIGMVPSKYRKMMEGLNKHIFENSDDDNDLSIFSFVCQLELGGSFESKMNEVLDVFEKLSKLHPEYDEYSTLKDDLEKFKKLSEKENKSAIEDIHGSLSLAYVYTPSVIREDLLNDSFSELEGYYEDPSTFVDEEIINEPQFDFDPDLLSEKGHPSLGDETEQRKKDKIKRKIKQLILHETMNAIFVHDKKGYVALSPLSEILIFADSSQEWDRIQFKKGEITRYTKKRIDIYKCEPEDGKIILGFCEEARFEEAKALDNIMSRLSDIFNDSRQRGSFGFFINLQADRESNDVIKPSQALFRYKYHPKIFDFVGYETRDEILIESFLRECKRKGGKNR